MSNRIHFPLTTAQQRRLLFETWQATGDVEEACRTAHVGRRTFYTWKPRFIAGSYAALSQFASRAPKHTRRTAATLEQQVIEMRVQHGAWGKQRIADERAYANGWVPIVSPNTIKRIQSYAALWPTPATAAKKGAKRP
jgi:hypothetical protein